MAITVTKSKAKVAAEKPAVEGKTLEKPISEMSDEELADQYGTLEDTIMALQMNPAFAKFKEVEKELLARINAAAEAEDEVTLEGNHWDLYIGAAGKNNRTIREGAMTKLLKFVGQEAFMNMASVTLKDIDKYCTPGQVEELVETDNGYNINKRKITATYKG